MAEIVARLYRDEGGYRAVVDGWGSFRGATLRETVENARRALENVVAGAFPDRPGIDPLGADLVVHFRLRLASEVNELSRPRSAAVRRTGSRRDVPADQDPVPPP